MTTTNVELKVETFKPTILVYPYRMPTTVYRSMDNDFHHMSTVQLVIEIRYVRYNSLINCFVCVFKVCIELYEAYKQYSSDKNSHER